MLYLGGNALSGTIPALTSGSWPQASQECLYMHVRVIFSASLFGWANLTCIA